MRKPIGIIVSAILLLLPRLLPGQRTEYSDAVFRVLGSECGPRDLLVAQTGFLTTVRNKPGIVTALHGVVGCKEGIGGIAARNDRKQFYNLAITLVDIPRDLAFLEVPQSPVTPLLASRNTVAYEGDGQRIVLRGVGYPSATDSQREFEVNLQSRIPVLPLIRSVNDKAFEALNVRKSPDLELPVLRTDVSEPGLSGSPLLDADGDVVGVANGGLPDSIVKWAIPFVGELDWVDAQSKANRLRELANLDNTTGDGDWNLPGGGSRLPWVASGAGVAAVAAYFALSNESSTPTTTTSVPDLSECTNGPLTATLDSVQFGRCSGRICPGTTIVCPRTGGQHFAEFDAFMTIINNRCQPVSIQNSAVSAEVTAIAVGENLSSYLGPKAKGLIALQGISRREIPSKSEVRMQAMVVFTCENPPSDVWGRAQMRFVFEFQTTGGVVRVLSGKPWDFEVEYLEVP